MPVPEPHEKHIWSEAGVLKKDRKSGSFYRYCLIEGCQALNIPVDMKGTPEKHEHVWSDWFEQDRFGYYRRCLVKNCEEREIGESRTSHGIRTIAIRINESSYHLAVACLPQEFRRTHPSKSYGMYLILNQKITVYASGIPIEDKIDNTIVDKEYLEKWYHADDIETSISFFEVQPKEEDFNIEIKRWN